MNRKGLGRKRLWRNIKELFRYLPGETETNSRKAQSRLSVSGPKFEHGTTAIFGHNETDNSFQHDECRRWLRKTRNCTQTGHEDQSSQSRREGRVLRRKNQYKRIVSSVLIHLTKPECIKHQTHKYIILSYHHTPYIVFTKSILISLSHISYILVRNSPLCNQKAYLHYNALSPRFHVFSVHILCPRWSQCDRSKFINT
jgi:hypothetical protein